MPSYSVTDIEPFNSYVGLNSALLWVLHADKIPPHIGLSYNGLFYSLKANGKDEGVSIESLIEIVNRRRISTLCFELNSSVESDSIIKEFRRFDRTIPNEITCLIPIKNVLNHKSASKLIELLKLLEENDEIERAMGLNIEKDFGGIQDYDVAAIHARLKNLDK